MIENVDKNVLQDVFKSNEFKGWLLSRRWFGDKFTLSNLDFSVSIEYFSNLATVIFLTVIKVEKPNYKKSYFLPMIAYRKIDDILEPSERNRDNIIKLTERTFSKTIIITVGTDERVLTLNLLEAEFSLFFWKKLLFDKNISESYPSLSLALTLYQDQFQDEISMNEVQALIEASLFPDRYDLSIKQLGGGNTTNSLFLLNLIDKSDTSKAISFVLKSYKEYVESIEPKILYILVKNKFPNAPKIYGTIKISGIETIGIIENIQNIGNIGDIFWNDVNKMIDDIFKDLDADFSKFTNKSEISDQIKEYFTESINVSEQIGAFINKLHKSLSLPNVEEYSVEEVESGPYLERYTERLNKVISELQNKISLSSEKTFYSSPKIGSILLDIKDILQKFRQQFKEEKIKIQIVHQDLHMEQILWNKSNNDQYNFYFIDFEGDPQLTLQEKKAKFPIEKDVAAFLRALSYIKFNTFLYFVEKRILETEQRQVPEEILYSIFFRKSARGKELDKVLEKVLMTLNVWEEKLMTKLLKALKPNITLTNYFTIERALNELNYELLFRPNKIIVPILGLKQIIEKN